MTSNTCNTRSSLQSQIPSAHLSIIKQYLEAQHFRLNHGRMSIYVPIRSMSVDQFRSLVAAHAAVEPRLQHVDAVLETVRVGGGRVLHADGRSPPLLPRVALGHCDGPSLLRVLYDPAHRTREIHRNPGPDRFLQANKHRQ